MGLKITNFFANSSYEDDQTQIIVCTECLSHLCLSSLVISDKFWGQSGEAYLVDQLINVLCAMDDLETQMKTGLYVINKIKCQQCSSPLGWVYKKSHNISEAYKEGKFVIERKYIHLIPNNLAFSFLAEQAKKLRRKRSSVSTLVSDDDSISDLDETYKQLMDKPCEHSADIREHGLDMPEIRNWKWESPIESA